MAKSEITVTVELSDDLRRYMDESFTDFLTRFAESLAALRDRVKFSPPDEEARETIMRMIESLHEDVTRITAEIRADETDADTEDASCEK